MHCPIKKKEPQSNHRNHSKWKTSCKMNDDDDDDDELQLCRLISAHPTFYAAITFEEIVMVVIYGIVSTTSLVYH